MRNPDALFSAGRPNLGLGSNSSLLNGSSAGPLEPTTTYNSPYGGSAGSPSTPDSTYSAYEAARLKYQMSSPFNTPGGMHYWNLAETLNQALHPAIRADYLPRQISQVASTPPQKKPQPKVQYKVHTNILTITYRNSSK